MNEQALEKLTALAAKLGTTAEYLWQIMVQAQYSLGLINLGWSVVMLIMVVSGIYLTRYSIKHDYIDVAEVLIFGGALTGLGVVCLAINLDQATIRLITPEYAALREIMRGFTK